MAFKEFALHIVSRGYRTYDVLENPGIEPVPWEASFCHSPRVSKDFLPESLVFFYAIIHCHPETGKHDADEPVHRSALTDIRISYLPHPPVLVPAA